MRYTPATMTPKAYVGQTAPGSYAPVAVLIVTAAALTALALVLAHLIGPKRHGPIKDSPYESGLQPIVGARRRFHVRFYLVAVLYLVFAVEVVFLYPWAVLFPRLRAGLAGQSPDADWASRLVAAGYSTWYVFGGAAIFFLLLVIGLIYEWRKGIFRWN
jgi:NADH-quinone oxidoreductase subunit A